MNKCKDENKNRSLYLDIIRIISCIFVLFGHTDAAIEYTRTTPGSAEYFTYMFMTMFIYVCIPLYFMISGALVLRKKGESIKDLWLKRILRIFIDLLVFSALYYAGDVANGKETLNIGRFFKVFFNEGWVIPFWFLYSYIGFLILVPVIRPMVQNMDNKTFNYLIGLFILFKGIIPYINVVTDYSISLRGTFGIGGFADMFLIYPIIGYYCHNHVDMSNKKKWLIPMWILSISAICISCNKTYEIETVIADYGVNETYYNDHIPFTAITMFLTFKAFINQEKIKASFANFLITVGGLTMGVYLFHPMLLERINILTNIKYWMNNHLGNWMNAMVFDIVYIIWIFTLGCIITWIVKKIPLLKKLV